MDRDPQQEFEALFEKLEPWQQQWVACRASIRVLPAVAIKVGFPFWRKPRASVVSLARIPWLVSFNEFDESIATQLTHVDPEVIDESHPDFPSAAGAATEVRITCFAGEYVREAAESAIQRAIKAAIDASNAVSTGGPAAITTFVRSLSYRSALIDAMWFVDRRSESLKGSKPTVWQQYFGRPLWPTGGTPSQAWERVTGRFRDAIAKFDADNLADRYQQQMESGADFKEIQEWLFGTVRYPSGKATSSPPGLTDVPLPGSTHVDHPESAKWWINLLYRLDLDDLGRTRVSVEPSLGTFEAAVRRSLDGESAAASGLSQGGRSSQPGSELSSNKKGPVRASDVAVVAEQLESQYGHLPAPPALWRAWFQAVHGERLRKIQDHFARGAE